LKGFKKDAKELNSLELQALEDRFMENFRNWSVSIADRANPRNHVLRLHYQAVVDLLLNKGFINTGEDSNKGNKS
jgi:putative sterol carrier protein